MALRHLSLRIRRRARSERGQTTSEYMLTISVIVMAVVAAAYIMDPQLFGGLKSWGSQYETYYAKSDHPNQI